MNVRVIIAGGRDFNDYKLLKEKCVEILKPYMTNTITIISGTANGADKLGEQFAREYRLHCVRMPADWERYGKRAGFLRNAEMAEYAIQDGSVSILIAFWDGKSKGTENMIANARERRMMVNIVRY